MGKNSLIDLFLLNVLHIFNLSFGVCIILGRFLYTFLLSFHLKFECEASLLCLMFKTAFCSRTAWLEKRSGSEAVP